MMFSPVAYLFDSSPLHIIIPIVTAILFYVKLMQTSKRNPKIHGNCDPEYESVQDAFKRNFDEGWEEEGAAIAVFHKGRLVVDLWGGYSERRYDRPWRENTLACVFSCTKSVGAICVAMLVDKGICKYDDRVEKYWPSYGKNGKEDTTIEMVLEHRAGLPYFQKRLELEDLTDDMRMRKLIEDEKPNCLIGKHTGYHTLTYGWILDSIFQSVDPNKRTIGEYLKEEIAGKYKLDIHMGKCEKEEYRFARLANPSILLKIREILSYPKNLIKIGSAALRPGGNFDRAIKNMRNFGVEFTSFNNPDLRIHSQPAVNAISTARALADLHMKAFDGTLLSDKFVETLKEPSHPNKFDRTLGERQDKGKGFFYTKSPLDTWQIGHFGVGGQIVRYDFENQLSIVYLCNGMKIGVHKYVETYNRLERRIYENFKLKQ